MRPVALTIAGSDSSGGAGLQADLATFAAHEVHGATVVTAVTAQDTHGVHATLVLPPPVLQAQLDAVLGDLPVRAIKTGMLATTDTVVILAGAIQGRSLPVVVDPVLIATSGDALAADGVREAILTQLVPMATLVTPNLDEAAALTSTRVETIDDMAIAAKALRRAGAHAALVTGGHLPGRAVDVLATDDGCWELETDRFPGPAIHGTGCTLSAAIAALLARGAALDVAVQGARAYVATAIRHAEALGGGARMLRHGHDRSVSVNLRARS